MELFMLRERDIFATLRSLQAVDSVLIGGYAVNAYVPARFSVDCDLALDSNQSEAGRNVLESNGYRLRAKNATGGPYSGFFMGFDKTLEKGFKSTFDLLVDEVLDRRTQASFSLDWIRRHSAPRRLSAKTYPDSLMVRIANPDALAVMKLVAGRSSDVRDVFMLAPILDASFVRAEVQTRKALADVLPRAAKTIFSHSFRNNLQGVFGYINDKTFESHTEAFKKLADD